MGVHIVTKAIPQNGQKLDLEQSITAYGKSIFRYCHLLLRDYHEAQDAAQTTFLRAYYKQTKKGPITGEFAPWLYKIAYNCCIDILRKRKRYFRFLDEEKQTAESAYYMEDGMSEAVREALGKLSPEDRALVISRLIDDMDYQQLSEIYNTNAATLRKRYERAKKRLAMALRAQGLEGAYGQE